MDRSASLRSRSTRRASQTANRAWASLHNVNINKSSSKKAKQLQPLSDLPFHLSPKQMKLSKTKSGKTDIELDLDLKSNTQDSQDIDLGLRESFVAISSGNLDQMVKREGLVCSEELRSTSRPTMAKEISNGLRSTDISDLDGKENIGLGVKTEDADGSDSDEDASYLKIREQNLKANQEFLARIGMQKAKEDFETSIAQKKKNTPTQRGLGKQKKEVEPLPRRQSLRIRRIDPTGTPLPDPEPVEDIFIEQRLPEKVTMKERHYIKNHVAEDFDLKPFFSSIASLKCENDFPSVLKDTKENRKLISEMKNLKITDNQVAKVVPARVYSVTWHPSKDSMIAIAGDAQGYVGCWNVLAKDDDPNMVTAFQPHIKPVTQVLIPPRDVQKMFTSSYDATLRCGDFEKGVFDLVFSVPEEDDDLFRNFDFIGNSSSMLVSHFSGFVSLVDCRTSSKSAEQVFRVSQSSLRKVSVHPTSTQYFLTAGRDANIKLWDLRSMHPKCPKAVQIMNGHSKAIASAFFSPISGNQIVSSSSDDTIMIHTASEGMRYDLTTTIRHNNHTGRWLTPFQPMWHPTAEGIFVSGSMARPRQIEVFNSDGGLITELRGDHLGSVCSLNAFHPTRPTSIVGANSSGRLHVFM